ncbi:MAG: DegT/DnrJ/EryC1/StrS aminotransferase family protein [Candidatus Omnitrophica bacterium]|nr:DegT/DnrJ/EryC1/StrS aminotransferase family protein [Candidatus Omnitrophota bacterium]
MLTKCYLPVYDERKSIFFALGRNAIYAACRILDIKADDEILTPAFDCDTVLQPFRVLGCRIKFFRQAPRTFDADIDDIKRQITPKTKLLHIINHFGMPQSWDKLLELRGETGIPILEDNAYSLFSSVNGKLFGTFGDISIFSLRKNLPLTDGGMLRINNPQYSFKLKYNKAPWLYSSEAIQLLGAIKNKLGFSDFLREIQHSVLRCTTLVEPPPLYSEKEKGYPEWKSRDHIGREFSRDYLRPISRLASFQLSKISHQDYIEIMKKKRQFYNYLAGKICVFPGIEVLWPKLPEEAVPFCVSCLVERRRDILLAALRRKYNVMAWPTLSISVLKRLQEFPEVIILGRKLLQFNLPADKVILPEFSDYIDRLVNDMRILIKEQ